MQKIKQLIGDLSAEIKNERLENCKDMMIGKSPIYVLECNGKTKIVKQIDLVKGVESLIYFGSGDEPKAVSVTLYSDFLKQKAKEIDLFKQAFSDAKTT